MSTFSHHAQVASLPSKAALSTLLIIHLSPGLSTKRLSSRLGVRPEATRKQCARLRELGLVEVIRPDPRDVPHTGRHPHGLIATRSGVRVLSYVTRIHEVLRRVEGVGHVA